MVNVVVLVTVGAPGSTERGELFLSHQQYALGGECNGHRHHAGLAHRSSHLDRDMANWLASNRTDPGSANHTRHY